VFLYPLFGLPLGHIYPRILTPVMPCPLTVFALAMIAAAAPKVDRKLYILLLPWALAGLPKCLGILDCYEDCILFAAGVYGLILLIKDWKAISTLQRAAWPRLHPTGPTRHLSAGTGDPIRCAPETIMVAADRSLALRPGKAGTLYGKSCRSK
jgi:hypothetical protein